MTSEEFKQARLDMGLTQARMAKLMGMAQPSLARIEAGKRQPTRQHAAAIRLLQILHHHNLLPP